MVETRAKDYGRVIESLSEVSLLNASQHSWLPARWKYATYLVGQRLRDYGRPGPGRYVLI